MKNKFFLSMFIALGGIAAFALRLVQNRTGFENDTGLPVPGNAAGIALTILLAGTAVVVVMMARKLPEQPAVFPLDFSTEDAGLLMLPMAGVFLVGISGALDLLLGMGFLANSAIDLPGIGTLFLFASCEFPPVLHLLMGTFSLVSAAALLLCVLRCRRKDSRDSAMDGAWLLVPVISLVVRLVLTYRVDSMNPSLEAYYVELLALVFLTLAFYRLSSFAFGSGRVRRFAVYCGEAVILTLAALADIDAPLSSTLLYLGGAAVLLGCLILLLTNLSAASDASANS